MYICSIYTMASRCISTIYDQNSRNISPRHSRGLISREFWSHIVDIHREAMVYIIYAKVNKNIHCPELTD